MTYGEEAKVVLGGAGGHVWPLPGLLDPADTVEDIGKLVRIVDESARQPDIDEGRRPTPLDFIQTRQWQVTSPALSGGVPVYEGAE